MTPLTWDDVADISAAVHAYLTADDTWHAGIGVYLPGEDVAAYVARRDAERREVHRLRLALATVARYP